MSSRETVETVVANSGISVGGLAFIVLFALKLTGQITLGWFWVVTSFMWVPLLLLCVVLACILAVFILIYMIAWAMQKLS